MIELLTGWVVAWLLSSVLVGPWFFMLARMKEMGYEATKSSFKDFHKDMGTTVTLSVLPLLLVGIVADVVFNVTHGTMATGKPPTQALFTQRVKREAEKGTKFGLKWKSILNQIMPDHV